MSIFGSGKNKILIDKNGGRIENAKIK